MDFLTNIAAEETVAHNFEPRPLRVLVALPRPLLTLLKKENGAWVPATDWDQATGTFRVLQLKRAWKMEAIEGALRGAGAPLEVRVLRHPTVANLRHALNEEYDVVIVDTHGDPDGTLCFEGPHGESHPLAPAELGGLLAGGGVRLALLSACHSAAACGSLRDAGVLAVVGMAESVREDAACAYLEVFLARLARGDRLGQAHARACDALRSRWAAQPGEADLPRLSASRQQKRRRLVQPGAKGAYVRLDEKPAAPAPPAPLVRLRGRELDQVLVQRALLAPSSLEGTSPLVTLSGFGGVGKTALALAVADWCWERALFPSGVRFFSLTDLRVAEGETLADRFLREFNFPPPQVKPGEDEYRAQVATLYPLLSRHPLFLLLDNFETACADERNPALLTQLRRHCPGLHILVTSRRAPLNLLDERIHSLQPLAKNPAVEVFCDRARHVGAVVHETERAQVAEICGLLARIPLHIRLVASHARAERPAAILEGLHDAERRHHLTAADLPDAPPHHRSRELSLRYTYDLLSEGGKRLWAVLAAIFAGSPDRAAVRAVYGAGAEGALDELIDWRVVEVEGGRHWMAEAVRDFGRARLTEGELGLDEAELRACHAAHYLEYAQAHPGTEGYDALQAELPDIFAGFDFVAAEATRDYEMMAAYNWAVQDVLKVRGYWDEVLRWLGETGRACEALGYWAGLAATYNNIGLIHQARGDYEAAMEWYERSVPLLDALGDRAGLATTYNNIASIHYARGEYEAALKWYEKDLAISEALGDRAGLATTYNNIATIHYARGEYAAALEWYERSVALEEELGDRAGLARTYNNIANIHYARGEYEAALEWYERSVELTEGLGDRAVLATTYNNIGSIHYARGDYEAALEWYEKSVAINEELGNRQVLATTYNNIGMIHDARGDYAAALEWYERSVALKEELGDRAGLATTYNNIGLIHYARGDYAAALEWYERSVVLKEALGDRAGLAATYNNIATIHYARGEYAAALEWYERSVALEEELGDRAGLARTYNNIANIHYARGEYEAALEWYERSVELTEGLGDRAVLATTYNNIGHVLVAQGRLQEALASFESSLALCKELGWEHRIPYVEEMIAEVQQQLGGTTAD